MLLLLDIVNEVQAFGIPLNYMTVEMGKIIGQCLGSVVVVD